MTESPGIYRTSSDEPPALSVEQRLEVLEILLDSMMFSAFDDQPNLKRLWSNNLQLTVQLCSEHQSLADGVLRELQAHADKLVEIDKYVDWLKMLLRRQ